MTTPQQQAAAGANNIGPMLYHLSLLRTQAVQRVVSGSFSSPLATEIVCVKHDVIELCSVDTTGTGALTVRNRHPLFAIGRAIATVPYPQQQQQQVASLGGGAGSAFTDLIAITTECGKLSLLRFVTTSLTSSDAADQTLLGSSIGGSWMIVSTVALGRSGMRVAVPGHYLAADPHGRAVMVAAPLRNKLVFPIQVVQDEEGAGGAKVVLGSPIECHRATVVHAVTALDFSPERNATFAVIEDLLPEVAADEEQGAARENNVPPLSKPAAATAGRQLCFYEHFPGLQQVQRIYTVAAAATAHHIIPLPTTGTNQLGGVLLCNDYDIVWESPASAADKALAAAATRFPGDRASSRAVIPRRSDFFGQAAGSPLPAAPMIIASSSIKVKSDFFLLMINELGDIYRVQCSSSSTQLRAGATGGSVGGSSATVTVRYFDTIPVVSAFAFLKRGFLFAAADGSSFNRVYKVVRDGYSDDTYIATILRIGAAGATSGSVVAGGRAVLAASTRQYPVFHRHGFAAEEDEAAIAATSGGTPLKHLSLCHQYPVISPCASTLSLLDSRQRLLFISLSGRGGAESTVQVCRLGLRTQHKLTCDLSAIRVAFENIIPLADPDELGGLLAPSGEAAASKKLHQLSSKQYHTRVVLCGRHVTAVFSAGKQLSLESTFGFRTDVRTLTATSVSASAHYTFVQVHEAGITLLRTLTYAAQTGSPQEAWEHPQKRRISSADCNAQGQVIAAFGQGGGLGYFDFTVTGAHFSCVMQDPGFPETVAVSIPSSSLTAPQAQYVAAATAGKEVFIIHARTLKRVEGLRCVTAISSVLLTARGDNRLFGLVGLNDGSLVRFEIDIVTGKKLSDSEFNCGSAPCRVVRGDGESYCYIQCSELWRCYNVDGSLKIAPVNLPEGRQAKAAAGATPQSAALAGGAAVTRFRPVDSTEDLLVSLSTTSSIQFYSVEAPNSAGGLTNGYSPQATSLKTTTGRILLAHPTKPRFAIVVGCEAHGYTSKAMELARARNPAMRESALMTCRAPNMSLTHASSIQAFDTISSTLSPPTYLVENDAAVCATIGAFPSEFGADPVLIIGCVTSLDQRQCGASAPTFVSSSLLTFRFSTSSSSAGAAGPPSGDQPSTLVAEFVHKTPIDEKDDFVSSVHINSTVGMLFVGFAIGGLHMYEFGKKRLLRKRRLLDNELTPSRIVSIDSVVDDAHLGNMSDPSIHPLNKILLVCGTSDHSVFVCRVHKGPNSLLMFKVAADQVPRMIMKAIFADPRTIVASDRLGSVFVLRIAPDTRFTLPAAAEQLSEVELDDAVKVRSVTGLQQVGSFFVGQVVNSLQSVEFPNPTSGTGGRHSSAVIYGTVLGATGAFVPFAAEEDAAMVAYGNVPMEDGFRSIGQRSALAFRSSFYARQGVVDGDLLELLVKTNSPHFSDEVRTKVSTVIADAKKSELLVRKWRNIPARTLPPELADVVGRMRASLNLSD